MHEELRGLLKTDYNISDYNDLKRTDRKVLFEMFNRVFYELSYKPMELHRALGLVGKSTLYGFLRSIGYMIVEGVPQEYQEGTDNTGKSGTGNRSEGSLNSTQVKTTDTTSVTHVSQLYSVDHTEEAKRLVEQDIKRVRTFVPEMRPGMKFDLASDFTAEELAVELEELARLVRRRGHVFVASIRLEQILINQDR